MQSRRFSPLDRRRFLNRCIGSMSLAGGAAIGWATCKSRGWAQQPDAEHFTGTDVAWLEEVTRIDPSSSWEPLPALLPADEDRRESTAGGVEEPTGKLRRLWTARRKELISRWQNVLGTLPERPSATPVPEVLETEVVDGIRRDRLRYPTLPGEWTEAYLLHPEGLTRPRPGFVVFHSTVPHSILQPAGIQGDTNKAFGWHLARLGCVALCPRNFLWPTNDRIDARRAAERFARAYPAATGMARMLWEAQLAVDILAAHALNDAARIGAIGHSLGAKQVLYLAALDPRVGAAVSSEGGVGLSFSNWDAPWYLGDQIRRPEFERRHHELLALCAPRPFLLVGGDSADGQRSTPYVAAAQSIYRLYGQPVRLGLYNHGGGHAVPPAALQRMLQWCIAYTS